MEYLKVWTNFGELLEELTDAECGRLFKAMLLYAESGETMELSGNERYVWPAARQSINNTRERSEQMKANASKLKQTEANASKLKQTEANASKLKQTEANASKTEQIKTNENKTEQNETKPSSLFDKDKVKDKDKDKDKVNKSTNVLSANETVRRFEKFWSVYPRHEGKQSAIKAFDKLKPDDAMLETMVNAIVRQKKTDQWSDPRYIPHPATWLNGRRWEDEPAKASEGKRVLAQQYDQREYNEEQMRKILDVDALFREDAS